MQVITNHLALNFKNACYLVLCHPGHQYLSYTFLPLLMVSLGRLGLLSLPASDRKGRDSRHNLATHPKTMEFEVFFVAEY